MVHRKSKNLLSECRFNEASSGGLVIPRSGSDEALLDHERVGQKWKQCVFEEDNVGEVD